MGHSAYPSTCARSTLAIVVSVLLVAVALVASAVDYAGLSGQVLSYVDREYGSAAKQRVVDWQSFIRSNRYSSDSTKLRKVNDFFNRLKFVDDDKNWGTPDYWATPVEFLAMGAGDCEDYSIAKFFTLLAMGVSEDKMRITYVKALELGQAHMVLTYYENPDSEPLVLDNLRGSIEKSSRRKDLKPVYSFNGNGLWTSVSRGNGKRVGGSGRISLWQDLNRKMDKEGRR